MSNDQQIADLQSRIDELQEQQDALRDDLAETQLEQWQGRLDDLDVQLHLGGMELRDRVGPALDRVQAEIAEARSRVEDGASSASDAVAALRTGVEQAWEDLTAAAKEARTIVSG